MSEAMTRPPRVTVHKTRRTILEVPRTETTQVSAVVERGPWLAAATTSTGGGWSIRISYLDLGRLSRLDEMLAPGMEPNKSTKPEFITIASGVVGSPVCLDISSDGVLVAAMRNGGVRMFMLVCSMPPVLRCNFYELSCQSFPSVCYAKFIAPAADDASLILSTTDTTTHTVALYKRPLSVSKYSAVQTLMKAPLFDITEVQASEPGKVVVLSRRNQCMYLLIMDEQNMFCMRTLPLSQFDGVRPGVPPCTPTALTVGDQLVAVGYCCTTSQAGSEVHGLVEAFSLTTGEMVARRSMRGSHPVAMQTNGPRIVVGAVSVVRGTSENPLYIFGVHDVCNYSVATLPAGESWSSARLSLNATSWAYTQRLPSSGSARGGSEIVWETVQASLSNAGDA